MPVARIVSLLLLLALSGYCAMLVVQDRRDADIVGLATTINQVDLKDLKDDATQAELTAAVAQMTSPSFSHGCRSDILRPGLLIMLSHLDSTNQAINYDSWADANAAIESYLGAMVRCLPADGEVWLREAMVSRLIAEDPKSLREKLLIARALMPFEAQQVQVRLYLWQQISPLALSTSEDVARADIENVLRYGSTQLKATLRDKNASDAFKALLKDESGKDGLPET